MKRLFAVLLVAALVMGGAFALDIAAGIRIDADLLNYDGEDVKALSVKNGTAQHENPLQFSVGTEKVGGQFKIWPYGNIAKDGEDRAWAPVMGGWTLWFKPLDGLQVNLGNVGTNLNCEKIDYWRTETGSGDQWGASVSYNNSGFFAEVLAVTGNGTFFYDDSKDDNKTLPLYAKAGYGNGDIGTIGAFINFTDKDNIKFGAGYANVFGPLDMFVNVLYNTAGNGTVVAELWLAPSFDIVSIQSIFQFAYAMDDADTDADESDPKLVFDIKANFNAGLPVTPYVRVNSWWNDKIADDFTGMSVQPGIAGNFGGMSYDIGLGFGIPAKDGDFTFNVPVVLKYNF